MTESFIPTTEPPVLRLSRVALWITGVGYVTLGIALGPFFFFVDKVDRSDGTSSEPMPTALIVVLGGFAFLVGACFGATNIAAAIGLKRRRKWAWFVALVLSAIYIPSCCLPIGALILYALLQKETRAAFGVT